jgi:outer membrane protein assembly factor BamB
VVGDLVVTTLLDGTLVALDRHDGTEVWTTDLGGGTNGWPAALDDRLIVPVGNADPPTLVAIGHAP